jgi:hypothetical protein
MSDIGHKFANINGIPRIRRLADSASVTFSIKAMSSEGINWNSESKYTIVFDAN